MRAPVRYGLHAIVLSSILVIGLIVLLTPVKIVSFLILLFGVATLLPLPKSFGILLRTALAFLFITSLQQVIGLVFWKLDIPFTYTWALLLTYAVAALALFRSRQTYLMAVALNRREVVAFLVALVSAGLIAFTTLHGGAPGQQLLRFITRGFDSSTHLSLTMSLYDNRGYLYGPVDQVGHKLVFSALTAYPEGWHLTTAVMWHGLTDTFSLRHIDQLLAVYFATVLLWYALLLFLFTNFIIRAVEKLSKDAPGWLEYGAIFSVVVLLQLTSLWGVMRYGFVNFVAIIAYLLALSILLLELYLGSLKKRVFLVAGSLLATGVALTWLLAAPIGYSILFVPLVLLTPRLLKLSELIGLVRKHIWALLLSGLFLAASFAQLLLQTTYNTVPDNINAGTIIWETNHVLYSFLFIVFVSALLGDKIAKPVVRTFVVSIFSVGLVLGGIYIFQYHTAAKIGYYSEKINVLLLIFLTAFLGALLAISIRHLSKIHGPMLALFSLVGIAMVTPVVFGINTSESRFAFATDRKLSPYTASQIGDLITRGQAFGNNVVVMKHLDYEEDVITTHFINVLSRKETTCSSAITWGVMSGVESKAISALAECADQQQAQTFYVITSKNNHARLTDSFAGHRNIRLILSN